MVISSRTPEGRPNRCGLCGNDLKIEPSDPAGDAPCPHCGHLLWFGADGLGDFEVVKLTGHVTNPDVFDTLFDSITWRRGMRIVLDFDDVPYLSSACLGKLINLKKKIGAHRGGFRIQGIHPDLREVFRICRLDRVFEIEE